MYGGQKITKWIINFCSKFIITKRNINYDTPDIQDVSELFRLTFKMRFSRHNKENVVFGFGALPTPIYTF